MAEKTLHRPKAEKRPHSVAPVHVQCEGFRCLAYRDKSGAWVDYHSGELLKGHVQIIQYGGG